MADKITHPHSALSQVDCLRMVKGLQDQLDEVRTARYWCVYVPVAAMGDGPRLLASVLKTAVSFVVPFCEQQRYQPSLGIGLCIFEL